ncbi:unnamed protein product [Rotaria magnacalcarata]
MLAIGNTAATPLAVTAVNGGLRRRYGCIRCSVWSFLVDDTAVYDTTSTSDDMYYHCDRIKRVKFSHLDPSPALAFAYKNEVEFDD